MANKDPWGWESEFLRGIEFVDGDFRGDFDKQIKEVKDNFEDLSEGVASLWGVIENFDEKTIRINDEEVLRRSMWDYLQE